MHHNCKSNSTENLHATFKKCSLQSYYQNIPMVFKLCTIFHSKICDSSSEMDKLTNLRRGIGSLEA